MSHRPLWNTETGWGIQNRLSNVGIGWYGMPIGMEDASAYVARAYVLLWASGVSRFYWYAWDNKVAGLTEADGKTLKPAATAYAEVENWLVGARLTSCGSDSVGTWTCEVTRDPGYRGWILWNPRRTFEYNVPSVWGVRIVRRLSGQWEPLSDGKIQIGPTPVLFERSHRWE